MFSSRCKPILNGLRSLPIARPPPPPRLNGTPLAPVTARLGLYAGAGSLLALAGFVAFGTSGGGTRQVTFLPTVVPPFDLENATKKLRTEEQTAFFDAGSGRRGQIFAVRLQSNSPTEDEPVIHHPPPGSAKSWHFWGVLDGHAGWATSSLLKNALVPHVEKSITSKQSGADGPIQSIKRAFVEMDNAILHQAETALSKAPGSAETISALAPAIAGSCALLSMYDPTSAHLLTACVGDSRAVLGRATHNGHSSPSYHTQPQSVDQTGKLESERARILADHPDEPDCVDPVSGRVLGLAVTRAFGDARWKWPVSVQNQAQESFFGQRPRPGACIPPPYLTAEPVVTETVVDGQDFLILATDGLWDHMRSEDAVGCVAEWVAKVRQGGISHAAPGMSAPFKAASVPDDRNGGAQFELEDGVYATWSAPKEHWVVEDDNVATHLVKNAFGGSRRRLFTGVMSTYPPLSRNVRDDVTVMVVFFDDVKGSSKSARL